ncbi:MAG: hypothetical protein BM485_03390 [Desulfobulbaceae bacterium DB1]|nr:MAG: hypothetical protein BM485_03390 [Desulfobulbaceae bacterium DB1]
MSATSSHIAAVSGERPESMPRFPGSIRRLRQFLHSLIGELSIFRAVMCSPAACGCRHQKMTSR